MKTGSKEKKSFLKIFAPLELSSQNGYATPKTPMECMLLEIHLYIQVVFIVDCAPPQCKRTHEENLWHPFIYSHVIVNGKWRSLLLVRWPFFSMKAECSL